MDNLISLGDILAISGLDDDEISALIPYAEAQAEAILGFLYKTDLVEEIYMSDSEYLVELEKHPINSLSEIKYVVSGSSADKTMATDSYRVVCSRGLVIFDDYIPEGYLLKVKYEVGWDEDTVTNLVKLFLVVLTVSQFYSLYPERTQSSQVIVSEKIGDYAIKYANISGTSHKSLEDWASYLGMLVKSGGNIPDVA